MRGVFDERDAERDRRRRGREERGRENGREEKGDREVTLGSFTLLAIFFALVILCGLSFGLGYVVGRREPTAESTVLEPTPIAAQGEGAKGKPSSGAGSATGNGSGSGAPVEATGLEGGETGAQQAADQQPGSDAGDASAQAGVAAGNKGTQKGAQSGAGIGHDVAALSGVPAVTKPQQAPAMTVQPALEPASKKQQVVAPVALMVQVATLEHQEDADVLVDALRRRGYAVTARRDAVDGMVHVRVGPFASREVANQWTQKLLNDGYNAVVESQ